LKIADLECEQCGSRNVRRARLCGMKDRIRILIGAYPFRCRDCQTRFIAEVLLLSKLSYAKCPRCLRTELSAWSRRHYNPGFAANLLIELGARKYRCPACRCNFVSFRCRLNSPQVDAFPENRATEASLTR
jgi:hypothetical protein